HRGTVASIVVDAANARVIASGSRELRVWALKRPTSTLVATTPCLVAHIQRSPDGRQAALDCNDCSVRLWTREPSSIRLLHTHVGQSFGVQWVRGAVCSGGFFDGHVMCSKPDGTDLPVINPGTSRITWLISSPDQDFLIFASADGKVWRYDDKLQQLYTQSSVYRLAVSSDGK